MSDPKLVRKKTPLIIKDRSLQCGLWPQIRERPRGVENSGGGGGGKHTANSAKNPSPKTFLDPPTYDTFPPPPFFGDSLSFPLKERGTDQTNPNFWGLQKWFWRAHSAVRFPPPPPKFTRYVLPPPEPLPKQNSQILIWILLWIFVWIYSSCFFQGRRSEKIHQNNPRQNSPGNLDGKIPSDFWRSPLLTN